MIELVAEALITGCVIVPVTGLIYIIWDHMKIEREFEDLTGRMDEHDRAVRDRFVAATAEQMRALYKECAKRIAEGE